MYWDQAYHYCHSINSQLVSFIDGDDNDFIQCKIRYAYTFGPSVNVRVELP